MNGYEILHKLGEGSYGEAYLAQKSKSKSKYVIKRIKNSHLTGTDLEDAKKEVKVLSSLVHDHITQFHDSFEANGFIHIVMEYCAGGDLQTLIKNRRGIYLPERKIVDWFIQLGLAVRFIHQQHIIHRDIKTQNVFLTQGGCIKLGDFGIAKTLDRTSDMASTCIGTPYYLSPEMCENKPYSNKSDIWSVGCVLYEMLSLKYAFNAPNIKRLILKISQCTYEDPPRHYSRALCNIIKEIFRKDPKGRPSMTAILSKPFLAKRLPQFMTVLDAKNFFESSSNKFGNQSKAKSHTSISAIRARIGVSAPASKYHIPVSRKRILPVCTPSNGAISKFKIKFSNFHINHNNRYPSVVTNSPIHSNKTTRKKHAVDISVKKMNKSLKKHNYYKNLNKKSAIIAQNPGNPNFIKKSSSAFTRGTKKKDRSSLDGAKVIQSPYNNLDKVDDFLVDFNNSGFSADLSKKMYPSRQPSFHCYKKSHFNLNESLINLNCGATIKQNIDSKVNSIITKEMIRACQNAKISRKTAYLSERKSFVPRNRLEIKKSSSVNVFLGQNRGIINKFNNKFSKENLLSKVNKSSFIKSFGQLSSRPKYKTGDYDKDTKDLFPFKETLQCQSVLFSKSCTANMTGTKANTPSLKYTISTSYLEQHELRNSLIEMCSSPELSHRSMNRKSLTLNMSKTHSLFNSNLSLEKVENKSTLVMSKQSNKDDNIRNIVLPKAVTKSFNNHEELLLPLSNCDIDQYHNLLTITGRCISDVDIKKRQDLFFFHQHSPNQSNRFNILNSFHSKRNGIKIKSGFSRLLKKLFLDKSSCLKSKGGFKSTHPEFVGNNSAIVRFSQNCQSPVKVDNLKGKTKQESDVFIIDNYIMNENTYESLYFNNEKLNKEVEFYQGLDYCTPSPHSRNFVNLKGFRSKYLESPENLSSKDMVFLSDIEFTIDESLSHHITTLDISNSAKQSPINNQKIIINRNSLEGVHFLPLEKQLTFQSENFDKPEDGFGCQISGTKKRNWNGLLYDSDKVAASLNNGISLLLSGLEKKQCNNRAIHKENKTLSSVLVLLSSYLEEIKREIDVDACLSKSNRFQLSLIYWKPVKLFSFNHHSGKEPHSGRIGHTCIVTKGMQEEADLKGNEGIVTSKYFSKKRKKIEKKQQAQMIEFSQSTSSENEIQNVSRFCNSSEKSSILPHKKTAFTIRNSSDAFFTGNVEETKNDEDVYGWMEEQRVFLEKKIGLQTFKQAYRYLESAFKKNHSSHEALLHVKTILGPSNEHLVDLIARLIATESVSLT